MMKKTSWCLLFLLTLLLVAIVRDGKKQVNYRQKKEIPPLSSGAVSTLTDDGIPLGPNISTCHTSFSEPIGVTSHSINCCPSRPDSQQPISDFEFPSPSSPIRIRRPAHRLTADDAADYLAKYNKAIAIMKGLPPDHPHSWNRQAYIHCLYCTGSYDRAHSTTPFNAHESWLFFPFHRYYVYFHERIIGKLLGDETFALPYWNWDSPEGMPIPSIYMEGLLHDEERERSHLPPKVADLSFFYSESGLTAEDQVATNLALMYSHMVSGATKPELFIGSRPRPCPEGECSEPGTIERAPHNSLHPWVGSSSNPEREHMGTFYAAARDPIFYAHHGNLDRMWELWRKGHGYRGSEPEFDDPRWLDSYFYFYDENLKLVRATVRDSIDAEKLRYAYEEIDLEWLDARPKPASHDILRSTRGKSSDNLLIRMPGTDEVGPWVLEKTVRVRVTRPKRSRMTTSDREEAEEEVVVVHGISINRDTYVKFDVYVNAVDDDDDVAMLSPRSREFAGCFVKINGGTMMKGKGKQDMKFGISEILKDLEADEDESIWVSLVPNRAAGNNITTTVDRISIEYIK